jgi:hypothetical protein
MKYRNIIRGLFVFEYDVSLSYLLLKLTWNAKGLVFTSKITTQVTNNIKMHFTYVQGGVNPLKPNGKYIYHLLNNQ